MTYNPDDPHGFSRPASINKKGYKTGYKKPPREHRWVRGQSGNPRGRPKKKKNRDMFEILESELAREITVVENGKEARITKREAIIIQTVNKAMQGDKKAMDLIRKFDEVLAAERQRRDEPQTHGVLLVGQIGEPTGLGAALGLTLEEEMAIQQAKYRGETPKLPEKLKDKE